MTKPNYLFAYIGTSKSSRKDIAHTVARELGIEKLVKHSTRLPRVGDVEGVDQHFVREAAFDDLVSRGLFFDVVRNDRGETFALAKTEVDHALASGRSAYVTMPDPMPSLVDYCQGRLIQIFTYTDREIYRQRLLRSGLDDASVVTKLGLYDRKLAFAAGCDHVVKNDTTTDAIRQVRGIVAGYLNARS